MTVSLSVPIMENQGGVVYSLDTTCLDLYPTHVPMFFKSKHSGFHITSFLLLTILNVFDMGAYIKEWVVVTISAFCII